MSAEEAKTAQLQLGHKHGTDAEEFLEKGDIQSAVEAHYLAAEAYLQAIGHSADDEIKRTLKLLYTNHTRQAKELSRRKSSSASSMGVIAPSLKPLTETSPTMTTAADEHIIEQPKQRIPLQVQTQESTPVPEQNYSRISSDHIDNGSNTNRNSSSSRNSNAQLDEFDHFWDTVELMAQKLTFSPIERAAYRPDMNTIQGMRNAETISNSSSSVSVENLDMEEDLHPKRPFTIAIDPRFSDASYGMRRNQVGLKQTAVASRMKSVEEYHQENFSLKQTINELTLKLEKMKSLEEENALLRRALLRYRSTPSSPSYNGERIDHNNNNIMISASSPRTDLGTGRKRASSHSNDRPNQQVSSTDLELLREIERLKKENMLKK